MNIAKRFSTFFGILGAILILLTAALAFLSLDAPVRMIGGKKAAESQTEELMEAICRQDYAAAGSLMLGAPQLNAETQTESEITALFWEAYKSSLSYEFSGNCYVGSSGLCRDVTVTYLDIPTMLQTLKTQFPPVLSAQVAETEADLVYKEDGTYKDDFVMEILLREAEALLEAGPVYSTRTVTLTLSNQDGQWLIRPDQALLGILSGSING